MTSQPVPVLLLVRELHHGGTERQLTETAKALNRRRFTPHVACFRPGGFRYDELIASGVPVFRLPVHSFRHPSVITAARQLARYIATHQIKLVHTFDVPTTLFAVPAARLGTSVKVLSSQRAHRDLVSRWKQRLLRLTDGMVDGIVANCEAVRRDLVWNHRVDEARVRVCYNGLDTRLFNPGSNGLPRANTGEYCTIGSLSVLRPEKNLESLLDAFALLRERRSHVRLIIVGSGPSLPSLMQRAQRLRLGPHCTFEPATEHVARFLRDMDVFVLATRSEALSNSLMEAMACGCAVVATKVGGNPELVEDEKTGRLYESGNVAALAARLQELVDDPGRRAALGSAAAMLIREQFSVEQAAARMADIYEEALATEASIPSNTSVT